jgi:hypothetical protein
VRRILAGVVACAALATAQSASAWTPYGDLGIDGFPLNMSAITPGGLDLNVEGNGYNEVFWMDQAGLNLAVYGEGVRGFEVYGFAGREPAPVSLGPLTGSGSPADPWIRRRVWRAGNPAKLEVATDMVYVNGRARVELRNTVRNITSGPVRFRASLPAHFDDAEPLVRSAPRRIGVRGTGQSAVLEELTPWAHSDLDYFNFVFGKIRDGTDFDDAYASAPDDLAAGGQWDTTTLDPGASATYSAAFDMTDELIATPPGTERACGEPHEVFITTRFGESGARPGAQLGWTLRRSAGAAGIETGTLRTDAAGDVRFAWTCENSGIDYFSVWLDLDGDGAFDPGTESGSGSQAVWRDPGTPAFPDDGPTDDDAAAAVGAAPAGAPSPQGGAAAGVLSAPRLRLETAVRRRGKLRIAGTLAADATGIVRIAWSAKLRGRTRRGAASSRVVHGRFRATLGLRAAARARRVVVIVRYAGDARHAGQTIRRVAR